MAMNIVRRLLYSRANRRLIGWAEKIMLPGFSGFSIYHVSRFFFHALFQGNLVNRAAAITYRLFISLFPAIIVLLTLIPFIPVANFQEKLLDAFHSMLPGEVYDFIEGLLHDLLIRRHTTLLSISFVAGLFLASNSINAILQGFRSSTFVTEWYRPWKQRLISLLLMFLLTVLCITATAVLTISSWGRSLIHSDGHSLHLLEGVGFGVLRWSVSVMLILVAISLLYHAGAPGKRRFHLFTPGAVLALVLVFLLSRALAFVFTNVTDYNALYGSIGVILAVQLWLYFNMIVLLIGYELNTSIAKARSEQRSKLRLVDDHSRTAAKNR
ncbi:MAG: YihY/virulence factor BrkB family protein [Flavobacteriales bacterium]|jgi:membrane protein|nr:YihY/virulence factor BrkB family protein [Flavobacteriales bacterium]MBK6892708.1 YihY/virulence factor BrkB family protein [Flavobacteriales bacterium]MBK7246847.1 YihY/virulence factor BrkB family protein [Flavobacteriales bacterium]MBK9061434.1 YihY/virulence factor BrkB family protein [Flavobacteriales bacterium]MBK9599232.1 YihY/virulence factor BrkB family protein [Flavobacteriales bacterium]